MELMFDVSNVVEEDRSFTPLPPGDYEVIVDDSDFRTEIRTDHLA